MLKYELYAVVPNPWVKPRQTYSKTNSEHRGTCAVVGEFTNPIQHEVNDFLANGVVPPGKKEK